MPAKQKRRTAGDWTRVVAQMSKNRYDLGIEALLRVFRFMRTDQLHRALFAGTTMEACRKTLRRLEKMGVVGCVRPRTFRRKGQHEGHWAYWYLTPKYVKEVLGRRADFSETAHLAHWEGMADLYLGLLEIGLSVQEYRTQVQVSAYDGFVADLMIRTAPPGSWTIYGEVDMSTEPLSVIDRKLAKYDQLMRWAQERPALDNCFLVFLVKTAERATSIVELMRRKYKRVPSRICFVVLRGGRLVRLVPEDQWSLDFAPLMQLQTQRLTQPLRTRG